MTWSDLGYCGTLNRYYCQSSKLTRLPRHEMNKGLFNYNEEIVCNIMRVLRSRKPR